MITASGLYLQFADRIIFNNITFKVNNKDKIGLVGRNGSGKSTLLNVLNGTQKIEKGKVSVPKGYTIGYLSQHLNINTNKTVIEETKTAFEQVMEIDKKIKISSDEMHRRTDYESEGYLQLIEEFNDLEHQKQMLGGYKIEENIEKVLKGLGFEDDDMDKPVLELSGGWQMRVELAKLLLSKPNLLLLDEPTNHLDIESITWLETFLKNYEGAVILVSHDKIFLDNITVRTIEITLGRIEDYKAPFTKYLELREFRKEQQFNAKKNQEKEIQQLEYNINRFRAKANKAKFAQSLIKKLDKLDRIEIEDEDTGAMSIRFQPSPRLGQIAVTGENLKKSYDDKVIIKNLNFEIYRGETIAFVGKNGMGKTTLARMIVKELKHEGKLHLGHNVALGYYAQHQAVGLHENKTVLEEIEAAAPGNYQGNLRSLLGSFLFSDDDVYKRVKVLSGGEKSRLALAKLLLKPINLLVLDEPTNHLDIVAKDVLKKALKAFDGTLIVVSHDRDFLTGLTEKVFEFTKEGIKEYIGDVNEFLRRRKLVGFRELELKEKEKTDFGPDSPSDNKIRFERKKELDKLVRKKKNAISKIEKEVDKLDKKILETEDLLKDPEQFKKLANDRNFFDAYDKLKKDLELKTSDWEKAVEAYTKLEKELKTYN